jgi:hypothetical protein
LPTLFGVCIFCAFDKPPPDYELLRANICKRPNFPTLCFAEQSERCLMIADIRKQFITPPVATSVELYGQVAMMCLGPQAAPPAHVSWLKNGSPLGPATAGSMLVSAEGHMLVSQASLQDMANYSCVAENVAGKRISESALLTVYGKRTSLIH